MMATVISPQQALGQVRRSLHLPESGSVAELSTALVSQAIRRAASILAPCARHELERGVSHSLSALRIQPEIVDALVESTLEALITHSDILEMRITDPNDWSTGKFVLRPSPPSFVQRRDGTIIILGVGGDVITPLSEDLTARIVYRDCLRMLTPATDEKLASTLQEVGLVKLDESSWLHLPSREPDKAHVAAWVARLKNEPICSDIEALVICEPNRASAFYPDRWVRPNVGHSGIFVARRPQRYGANLWCLAELHDGKVVRFFDLFAPGDRNRACDVAWRIQMALDSLSGAPQAYHRRRGVDHDVFDFFGPIPSWAERRLALSGRRLKGVRCLFSYEIPTDAADSEGAFLGETLWLTSS